MVCQEVVDIESRSADGWFEVEAGVGTMPVVLVDPGGEMAQAVGGVLIETSVSPFADGGLDETFRLAIGAGSVDASANVAKDKVAAGLSEQDGAEARAIVGHDAADADAELSEVGDGLAQEGAGGSSSFVGKHGGESDAGVIVDGNIEELPTGAASFVLGVAGETMTGLMNAGQFLDVDVQQVAGSGMFVAHDGQSGFEHTDFVQLPSRQDAAHRGPAKTGGQSYSYARPALTSQSLDFGAALRGCAARRLVRTRAAIAQSGAALGAETSHPLGRALPAELELGRGLVQAQPAFQYSFGKFFSTIDRKSSMMVIVHSVSSVAAVSSPSASQFSTEWTTTY